MNIFIDRSAQSLRGGFVLLELLIAMVVLITAFSAVTLVSVGSQTFVSDSQNATVALVKANDIISSYNILAQTDFNQINSTTSSEVSGGIQYTKKIIISNQPDFYTKKGEVSVSWNSNQARVQFVSLTTLFSDYNRTSGDETCDSNVVGDWSNPQVISFDLASLAGNPGSVFTIGGINAYKRKLYITAKNTGIKTDPTLFIFDISNPISPVVQSKIDDSVTTFSGLGALDVSTDVLSGSTFAYIASARSVSGSPTFGQLQILDVTNPILPVLKSSFKISDALVSNTSQSVGNAIYYKDGYIYLGLTKTGGGPEFNVIDVRDHSAPLTISSRVGLFNVGSTINAIKVKNGYAYLATTDDQELKVLDITNPTNPWLIFGGGYDAPDSVGSGKSLALVGDRLYFGRTFTATHPELYFLDNSNPTELQANNQSPFIREIGSSVIELTVKDYLVFILTTTSGQFQVFDFTDPSSIQQISAVTLPYNSLGAAMDCERGYFYVGSNDVENKGKISIISSGVKL